MCEKDFVSKFFEKNKCEIFGHLLNLLNQEVEACIIEPHFDYNIPFILSVTFNDILLQINWFLSQSLSLGVVFMSARCKDPVWPL